MEQDYEIQGGEPAEFHLKIKKNTALFMVYQIGRDEEEEGENEVFIWLTNSLFKKEHL